MYISLIEQRKWGIQIRYENTAIIDLCPVIT